MWRTLVDRLSILKRWPHFRSRASEFALALLLLVSIFATSALVISSLSIQAVVVPDATSLNYESINARLKTLASNDKLRPGAETEIATLRKNDGSTVSLIVAEGWFKDTTIEPKATWSKILGGPSAIVSSADELLRNDGGISESIAAGCSIKSVPSPLPTGQVTLQRCTGNYKEVFPNLEYVASAIVVAWEGVDETRNCKFDAGAVISQKQSEYKECLRSAIITALGRLFYLPELAELDVLVMPALGTGTGQLPKGEFYNAASQAILSCLQTKGCAKNLPRSIVLAVWSGESNPNAWTETRRAIVRNILSLGQGWIAQFTPDLSLQKEARYIGVLLTIFVFVLAYCSQGLLPLPLRKYLPSFGDASLWLVAIGWFLVAAGVFSVFSDFFDLPIAVGSPHVQRDVIANILFGIAAALSCGVIHRATKIFQGK